MSTYEPGTVAVATVRGVEGVRVMRAQNLDGWVDQFGYAHTPEGVGLRTSEPVTDVRPLMVIDLGDYDNRAVTYLRNIARGDLAYDGNPTPRAKLVNLIADQIEAQLTPPRIPEPGLWGVVREGVDGDTYVRESFGTVRQWSRLGGQGLLVAWDEIKNPTLVREGLS